MEWNENGTGRDPWFLMGSLLSRIIIHPLGVLCLWLLSYPHHPIIVAQEEKLNTEI